MYNYLRTNLSGLIVYYPHINVILSVKYKSSRFIRQR